MAKKIIQNIADGIEKYLCGANAVYSEEKKCLSLSMGTVTVHFDNKGRFIGGEAYGSATGP